MIKAVIMTKKASKYRFWGAFLMIAIMVAKIHARKNPHARRGDEAGFKKMLKIARMARIPQIRAIILFKVVVKNSP